MHQEINNLNFADKFHILTVMAKKASRQMAELGTRGGMRTKRRVHKVKIDGKIVELQGKEYYSYIARMSHRKHNPTAKRSTYENGGRKPKAE